MGVKKLLDYLYVRVSECLTQIAVNTMERAEGHCNELIERNSLSLKYAGFLPTENFDLSQIQKLEEEEGGNTDNVIKRLDEMFDRFQSNELQEVFRGMGVSRTGNFSMTEVIDKLNLKDTALMRHVLSSFGTDGNNVFDLSEFKFINENILRHEMDLVFTVFDVDKNKLVSKEDVIRLTEIESESKMKSSNRATALDKLSKKIKDPGWTRRDFRQFLSKHKIEIPDSI
ncbi:hypothetical protein QYM36_004903 [Artemia franciscana]|uniref:Uncharacterized protein n=1 Tax=Artemia franciscana TaxID=6661 RepID=A0AA88L6X7_ARTSF|nr:hypothetical protein QYM36_004903 [Artemia franciscana]